MASLGTSELSHWDCEWLDWGEVVVRGFVCVSELSRVVVTEVVWSIWESRGWVQVGLTEGRVAWIWYCTAKYVALHFTRCEDRNDQNYCMACMAWPLPRVGRLEDLFLGHQKRLEPQVVLHDDRQRIPKPSPETHHRGHAKQCRSSSRDSHNLVLAPSSPPFVTVVVGNLSTETGHNHVVSRLHVVLLSLVPTQTKQREGNRLFGIGPGMHVLG